MEKLTEAQRDGLACVVCGVDYTRTAELIPNRPVGTVDGCQVFACASHAAEASSLAGSGQSPASM